MSTTKGRQFLSPYVPTACSPKEIADFLKNSLRTVQGITKAFNENKNSEVELSAARRVHDHSESQLRSEPFLEELHSAVQDDPSTAIQSLAAHMKVSTCMIEKVIHENLWYKSYVLKMRQHLTDSMRAK